MGAIPDIVTSEAIRISGCVGVYTLLLLSSGSTPALPSNNVNGINALMEIIEYSEQAYEIAKRPYTKYALKTEDFDDGTPCYISVCKEFNGCMSQGETSQEALEMLEDALLLSIQCLLDDGLPIPEPSAKFMYNDEYGIAVYYYSIDFSEFWPDD